jgi:uncharacterized phage protein gp47/JayE
MIDPGNPFLPGHDYGSLVTALQESLLLGVEHEESYRFTFDPAVRVYDLPRETTSVVRVTGIAGGRAVEFVAGRDYDAGLSRVVWRAATAQPAGVTGTDDEPRNPDPRTPAEVTYRFRDVPSGLSDVGPGSIAGTLLRAFGRELTLLHQQVNEAYRRAFLDTANGAALDGVVALLGVARNPAQPASGTVTFSRRQPGAQLIVPAGAVVEDAAQRRYRTTADAVLGEGEKDAVATVQAVEAGPAGNNDAGALTLMPTPPTGVDAVTNAAAITGGLAAEPDDALRERARHALERAGNATTGALEFAVRDVDGVEDVAVIDHTVDLAVPLGEVRVRYSAGGDAERRAQIQTAVEQVVDRTRAAGVQAVAEQVQAVTISGQVIVVGTPDGGPAGAAGYADALRSAIDGTGIGRPLSLRKLVALVFSQPGLADVLEAQLTFGRDRPRPSLPAAGDVGDLLPVDHAEHAVAGTLAAVLVEALAATAPAVLTDPVPITVSLLHGGQPVSFRSVRLQVRVEVRAGLLAQPSQPPGVVADVVKEVLFDHAGSAVLTLTTGTGVDQDLHGYHPGEHTPDATATLTLVGYPVPAATAPLVLG